MYRLPLFILGTILSWNTLFSSSQIEAVYTAVAPVIDGRLDEPEWEKAQVISEFYQREPFEGRPVTEDTEFYILYDEENLYIGAHCYHRNPADIISREMARDVNLGYVDRIQIILDTYLDGRNGYWFQIGPRGSIGDALVSENGRGFNKAWDGIWDGRTYIHERGWDAEIIIPFRILGFHKGGETRHPFSMEASSRVRPENGIWACSI